MYLQCNVCEPAPQIMTTPLDFDHQMLTMIYKVICKVSDNKTIKIPYAAAVIKEDSESDGCYQIVIRSRLDTKLDPECYAPRIAAHMIT